MHRTFIRNPLNKYGHIHRLVSLEAGTERKFDEQNMTEEATLGRGSCTALEVQKPLAKSSGELWGIYSPSELSCLGRKWLDIYICLNQSLDGAGDGVGRRKSLSWRKPTETLANLKRTDRWRLSAGSWGNKSLLVGGSDTFPFFPVIETSSKSSYTFYINSKE